MNLGARLSDFLSLGSHACYLLPLPVKVRVKIFSEISKRGNEWRMGWDGYVCMCGWMYLI